MDNLVIILLAVIVLFFAVNFFEKLFHINTTTEEVEEEEEEEEEKYESEYTDKIAIELIKGTDPAEIIEREEQKLTIELLEEWKENFLKDIEDYAKNRRDLYAKLGRLQSEIEWFEKVCEEHIGEDWKEQTEFEKHRK